VMMRHVMAAPPELRAIDPALPAPLSSLVAPARAKA
jgi:hypothetical protein